MSESTQPTPPAAPAGQPPHINLARLLEPVIRMQSDLCSLLASMEKPENPEKKVRAAELQREIPRKLRDLTERALDTDPRAFGHELMPTLMRLMIERSTQIDLLTEAEKSLGKLRALSVPGQLVAIVFRHRDDFGQNLYSDAVHIGVFPRDSRFSATVTKEPPFRATAISLDFERRLLRIIRRDDSKKAKFGFTLTPHHVPQTQNNGGNGDIETTIEALAGSLRDDRFDKFLEGLSGSTASDAAQIYVGPDEIACFLGSPLMSKHPMSLRLFRSFMGQE